MADSSMELSRLQGGQAEGLTQAVDTPSGPRLGRPLPVLLAGEVVAGRFRVLRLIGQGGMGQVFAAQDLELGTKVALKVVRPEIAGRPGAIERFKQEVHLARQVTHPNVCRIFDLFHHDVSGDHEWGRSPGGLWFLTMELLEGETLAQWLRRRGALPPERALRLLAQISAGIDAAHDAGIVHRDLKSSNVLLVGPGGAERAVVTDFGLAGASHSLGGSGSGTPGGTPGYIAPEIVAGGKATVASDIFAFGVVAHELITGHRPERKTRLLAGSGFPTEVTSAPLDLSSLDRQWEPVVARCLDDAPEERFGSAGEAVETLEGQERSGRHRSLAGALAALGVAFALALAGSFGPVGGKPPVLAAPSAPRPSVAVLGFSAPERDLSWLAALLTRSLRDELRAGQGIEVASSELTAAARRDLEEGGATIDLTAQADRVSAYLGTGWWVTGEVRGGAESVEVAFTVVSAADGTRWESVVSGAAEPGVLAAEVARELRAQLRVPREAPRADDPAPLSRSVARKLAEGLSAFEAADLEVARERLEEVTSEAPEALAGWEALTRVAAAQGYERRSREAAERALALAQELSAESRLRTAGLHLEATKRWREAVGHYETMRTLYPNDLEYGLRLMSAQSAAGLPSAALELAGELRPLAEAPGSAARLDLAEAEAARARADFGRQLASARRAEAVAGELSAPHLLAESWILELGALDKLGEPEAASLVASELRAWSERSGDRRVLAEALLARDTNIEASQSQLGITYEEASEVFREAGNREKEADTLLKEGAGLAFRGEFEAVRAVVSEAARVAEGLGNPGIEADLQNAFGFLAFFDGEFERATRFFDSAITLARESGNLELLCEALNNSAGIAHLEGELDRSRQLYGEALAISEGIGSRLAYATIAKNTAWLELATGGATNAEALFEEAAVLVRELREPALLAEALDDLGMAKRVSGKLEEARTLFDEALDIATLNEDSRIMTRARLHRAEALAEEGELERALPLMVELFEELDSEARNPTAWEIRLSLADTYVEVGQLEAAEALLPLVDPEAWDFAQEVKLNRLKARVGSKRGVADEEQILWLEGAIVRFRREGNVMNELITRADLSEVLLRLGRVGDARRHAEKALPKAEKGGYVLLLERLRRQREALAVS